MAKPIEEMSAAALAYLGDSVIELCVRQMLVEKGVSSAKNLNSTALLFVKAEAQADAMKIILPALSEEENGAYRRGRNIGHTNVPKSATVGQYRMATGMEALFGKNAGVVMNRKVLSDMAINDAEGFAKLAELAKANLK